MAGIERGPVRLNGRTGRRDSSSERDPHAQAGTVVPYPDGGGVACGAVGGEAVGAPAAAGTLASAGQAAGKIGDHIRNLHRFDPFSSGTDRKGAVCREAAAGSGRDGLKPLRSLGF